MFLFVFEMVSFFAHILFQRRDAESGHRFENNITIGQKQQQNETQAKPKFDGTEDSSKTGQRRKRNKRRRNLQNAAGQEDGQGALLLVSPIILEGDDEGKAANGHGLLDVLMKDNGVDMEDELASQDFDAICRLEKEFREQNIDVSLCVLHQKLQFLIND